MTFHIAFFNDHFITFQTGAHNVCTGTALFIALLNSAVDVAAVYCKLHIFQKLRKRTFSVGFLQTHPAFENNGNQHNDNSNKKNNERTAVLDKLRQHILIYDVAKNKRDDKDYSIKNRGLHEKYS